MGHAPDWCRKNFKKMADGGEVVKMADGREVVAEQDKPEKLDLVVNGGGSGDSIKNFGMGGRAALRKELSDDSDVEVGVSGHAARWRTQGNKGSDIGVDAVDVRYRKGDTTLSVGRTLNNTNPDMGSTNPGNRGWTFNVTQEFADGGKVKKAKKR